MRQNDNAISVATLVALALAFASAVPALAEGDAEQGVRQIKQCFPCHSMEPGKHMTGPSLAEVIGRKAGSLKDFDRYSPALQKSAIVWDKDTLNAWLASPQKLVPGNSMQFSVEDAKVREDMVAYLLATQGEKDKRRTDLPKPFQNSLDLKSVGAASQIAAITYCRDTYTLKMENGTELKFWERNLRFKTDSSNEGPPPGKAVLVPSGQMGDRAYVVVGKPEEMSGSVKASCSTNAAK